MENTLEMRNMERPMDTITLHSTVKPDVKRRTLFRGTLLAGIGAFTLLFSGAFLPVSTLKIWGLPIFFVSIGLIAVGMVPYRRLCHCEENPDKIVIGQDEVLRYFQENKEVANLPFSAIDKITPVDGGIKIALKTGQSLFFPNFSPRSCQTLKQTLELS